MPGREAGAGEAGAYVHQVGSGPRPVDQVFEALLEQRKHRQAHEQGQGRAAGALASFAVLSLTGLVSVFLGVHWPSDVLGGYIWGLVLLLPLLVLAGVPGRRWYDIGRNTGGRGGDSSG